MDADGVTADVLRAVSGTGPTDVFAVGYGSVFHYDGVSWNPVRIDDDLALSELVSVSVRPGLVLFGCPTTPEAFALVRTGAW